MARSARASLLKPALGVALATLVAVSPAAAANGGAAPSASSETAGGGAAPMAAVAAGTSGSGAGTAGGAAAGAVPPAGSAPSGTSSGASSRKTGGAAAGARPPKRAVPRRQVKPRRGEQRRAATPRRAARRGAGTPPVVTDPSTVAGVFPVQGSSWTFGGEGSRFGAGRPGHIHQGQDVSAPSGTPLVSPVAGTVTWKANQPKGAGIYVIVRGAADGRDYVFMHLKSGSVLVTPGQTVAAGEALAQVGSTGASSGPHLHFEIWVGGWQADGGAPIDPLPQLQRWSAGTA